MMSIPSYVCSCLQIPVEKKAVELCGSGKKLYRFWKGRNKMKKLSILLIVLALCLPAYSAYSPNLVYSVSCNVRGAMGPVEGDWTMERGIYHGYVVVGGEFSSQADIALIMYGCDGGGYKVYEFIDIFIHDYFLLQNSPYECVVGIGMSEEDNWATLTGSPRMWNIGGIKALIPLALTGHILIWGDMPFTEDEAYGCGIITARLQTAWTKKYNGQGLSFAEVVDAIEAHLIGLGYEEYGI